MHTEMRNIMRNIPSIQMMDAMARGEARAEARILENIIKAVHEGKIPLNISAETAETAREKLAEESLAEESLAEEKLTEELLKFFTKEEVAVFFKRIKELNSESNVTPAQHIDYQLNRPIEDAEREKRYKTDYSFRRGVDAAQAEIRENFIRAVHEGRIGILMARDCGFDVEQEMIARGISIPDQDLLDIKFYKIRYENAILDKGIKELLKIFTRDEVVKYLEFVIRRDA